MKKPIRKGELSTMEGGIRGRSPGGEVHRVLLAQDTMVLLTTHRRSDFTRAKREFHIAKQYFTHP